MNLGTDSKAGAYRKKTQKTYIMHETARFALSFPKIFMSDHTHDNAFGSLLLILRCTSILVCFAKENLEKG